MRFMHMADTHLGYAPYHLEEREDDIYENFKHLVDVAIEEKVDFIVHSGDFFHNFHPSNIARKIFMDQMKRLEDRGIRVFGVLGDHDFPKRRDSDPLVLYPNVKLLGYRQEGDNIVPNIIEYRGATLVGFPSLRGSHKRVELLHNLLGELEKMLVGKRNVILVLHQAIKEYFSIEGQYELELGHLPNNVDYYALGHLHDRRYERFGKGYIAYAGSIDIMRRSEIAGWEKNGKGAYLVDMDGDVDITPINLDIRPHKIYEVRSAEELERELNGVEFKRKPVVYVTLNTEERDMPRNEVVAIEEKLRNIALHYEISVRRKIEDNGGKIVIVGKMNMEKIFKSYYGDENLTRIAYELFEALKGMKDGDFSGGMPKEVKEILARYYGGDLL